MLLTGFASRLNLLGFFLFTGHLHTDLPSLRNFSHLGLTFFAEQRPFLHQNLQGTNALQHARTAQSCSAGDALRAAVGRDRDCVHAQSGRQGSNSSSLVARVPVHEPGPVQLAPKSSCGSSLPTAPVHACTRR